MIFKVEYQYDCWEGREATNGNYWWVEDEKTFTSKASRTRYINKMNERYQHILFRPKGDEESELEEIEEVEISTLLETEIVMSEKTIITYTDGSAHYKDGFGGIGIYMKWKEHEKIVSTGYSHTTNNRMELRAVIEAMKLVHDKSFQLHIYSDSEYVINTFTNWIFKWEIEGYVGRKNIDLLKEGLQEYRKFPKGNLFFHWVKGHNGIMGNEIADILAGEARKSGEYIKCQNDEKQMD